VDEPEQYQLFDRREYTYGVFVAKMNRAIDLLVCYDQRAGAEDLNRDRTRVLKAIADMVNPASADVKELLRLTPECSDLAVDELACEIVQRAIKRRATKEEQ